MPRISDTVQERVKELYAMLATAAAAKALSGARIGCYSDAEYAAKQAETWLIRAGAGHARYTYEKPKL